MTLVSSYFSTWLRPDWPVPERVHARMTDRHGGVSPAPWDSMNLGAHVGDDPSCTHTNRQRLSDALGTRPVFLQQVHGVNSVLLDNTSPDGIEADACIATDPGVACTIMVADCLPVLLCDSQCRWVAAAHAGWRGLAGDGTVGVLEALLSSAAVRETPRHDILVWLGPCIGPLAFEVGAEVRAAFCDADPMAEALFEPNGSAQYLADLAGLARRRLGLLGLHRVYGNNSQSPWCTATQSDRFFSHRRDSRVLGQSGRMAACIWLSH